MNSYRERLHVPASYWLLTGIGVALIGAEVFAGFSHLVWVAVYVVLVVVVVAFFLNWGRARIEVSHGALRAGGDVLPLSAITAVEPLDERQAAALTGPRADPGAHLLLRPYLKNAVYIGVDSPAGGAPYWLIATRHPAELAAALAAAAPERAMMRREGERDGEPAASGTRRDDGEAAV